MSILCTSDENSLLEAKIGEANALLADIGQRFKDIEGIHKLCNRVKAEIKFLTNLRYREQGYLKRSLDTSNLLHFRGIVECASLYERCTAFCKSYAIPNETKGAKLEVDLVLNDGETWVKVISRNARGLALDYVASGGSSNRSTVEQARYFKIMATNYPYFYKPPEIIFQFLNGVPDSIIEEVASYGVKVVGKKIPIGQLITLPDDSASDSLSSSTSSQSISDIDKEEDSLCKEGPKVLNLDITAVFALISALTHMNGANFRFSSPMLNDQAKYERKRPVLPNLLKLMEGKKLIICRTAYNSVQNILRTVAGPEEKKRAEDLFRKVVIVDDKLSERAAALKMSDKINQRSKIIFGSGDYYKAVTITANRHFVNAASFQGLRFAVILHDSRALSEQKQMSAEPL